MLREAVEARFESWILSEVTRARERVRGLKTKYPSAAETELGQRLIDEKKKWAATGGALSGLFGLMTLPADLAFVAYLQMSLIVDLAVLCGRNVKSARAREEIFDIFRAANSSMTTASRASPKALARITERFLAAKGLRLFGRAFPLVAAPVTAALNNRDLQLVGEEAMRFYAVIPRATKRLRG
jgi:hypothetical protein